MSEFFSNTMVWLLLGGAIIISLSAIAGYYVWALYQQSKRQQRQMAELREAGEAQRKRVNNSIQILAQAILSEQVTLTEGAIRIKVLLDSLSVDDVTRESYRAFYLLAQATDHIPILEEWKSLSTKKKLELNQQREKLEKDHREFVCDAAQRIQGQQF